MFDELVAEAAAAGSAGVGAWARVESAACARRLAAMVTMLDACYAADGSADREQWYLDNWGAACAEIGAAQQLTSGAASRLLMVGTALRDRLPRVGAVFSPGPGVLPHGEHHRVAHDVDQGSPGAARHRRRTRRGAAAVGADVGGQHRPAIDD